MNSISEQTLALTKTLINRESITPEDAGCQKLMTDYLAELGFSNEFMPFEEVKNFWSTHKGTKEGPTFVFAGHTDVVPAGPIEQWNTPPFIATEDNGLLYGRGAADMKASLAAMMVATKIFIQQHPKHKGTLAYLITSDEEGPFVNGTVRVVNELMQRKQPIDYCIVGEPSSSTQLGDVIRIGRRGSLTGYLKIHGIQGHVAYPESTLNAVHDALVPLQVLSTKHWDDGNKNFPPTSFQICLLNAGTATNVVPGTCYVEFNFRFSNEQTSQGLMKQVEDVLIQSKVEYSLDWKINGEPFLTPKGELIEAVVESIDSIQGVKPELSTAGGTSDGRFIAQTGAQVIKLGPINASIHKINESVKIADLEKLVSIYVSTLKQLLL